MLNQLEETYGAHSGAALFSAPGRTEIGGNHTDHQQGCVLAGAVNIDMIAAVGENNLNQLRLTSEGYAPFVIDLNDLEKKDEEENTSFSILRGTLEAAWISRLPPMCPRAAAFLPLPPSRFLWEPS